MWRASDAVRQTRRCSCGYDLERLAKSTKRCPECGLPRGHVGVRHPHLLLVGVGLLLFPLLLVVVLLTLGYGMAFW